MIASFLFLLLGVLLGFVLLRFLKSPLKIEEQVVWGIPIGIMLLALWTFLWALVVRYHDIAIAGSSLTATLAIVYYLNLDNTRVGIAKDWHEAIDRTNKKDVIAWLIVLIPWLTYTIITIPSLLFFQNGNLMAGWTNVWADWAVHLRNSTFFAASDTISLENPIYSGSMFHYPYLSSYLSAILQRLHLPLDRSLTWPTFALFVSLPPILYTLGRRFTNSRKAGILFTYLVLGAGSVGVYYLFKDILAGDYFWLASAYSPKTYTDLFRINGQLNNNGIWFMNFIMSEFIPQRAFLAGLPLALYVLYVTWTELVALAHPPTYSMNRKSLIGAGLLFGFLPLIHTHSFIALGLIIPIVLVYCVSGAILKQKQSKSDLKIILKPYFTFALTLLLPATLIGFSLLFLLVFNPAAADSFAHRIHWWVPEQDKPVNPLIFWLRNAGPMIIFGLIAWLSKKQPFRPLLVAGAIIFGICNFYSFQPWQYDNLKILTYWYILWALPVAVLIARLSRQFLILPVVLVVLLTGAGLADTLSVTVSARTGLQLASADGLVFAQKVKAATAQEPDTLLISATNHDHPISLASGRRLYQGYEGWLWTYGIDWVPRHEEIKKMYRAETEGLNLLKEKNINYIVLGPNERNLLSPNEAELLRLFPVVAAHKDYQLLRVRGL